MDRTSDEGMKKIQEEYALFLDFFIKALRVLQLVPRFEPLLELESGRHIDVFLSDVE